MPELPEVETTVRGLKKSITGLVIKDVWTDLSSKDKRSREAIANSKYFKIFRKEILGKRVLSVERRAKNILINLSGKEDDRKTILIHLKMTGHLLYGKYIMLKKKWAPEEKTGPLHDPYNRFVHVVFTFAALAKSPSKLSRAETHLAFSDARKFGKITLLDTRTAHDSKHLNNIGPEPLLPDFTLERLKERLARKPNGNIKTVLMDQSVIAGIGNIYSDEILWRAGVHPERKASKVATKEMALIFKAIKEVLTKGIDFGGDSMSDYRNTEGLPGKFQLHHEAYRRTGEKCRNRNCRGIIARKVVNGRSAHFCSAHQK